MTEEELKAKLADLEDKRKYLASEAGEFSNSGRRWVYLEELEVVNKQIAELRALLNLPEDIDEDEDQFDSGDNPKQR